MDDDRNDDTPPGDFSWHELATHDWRSAWDFYRSLFGWERESEMDMGPAGTYFMFKRQGGVKPLGGIYNKPPEVPAPAWLPYILVPSADKAVGIAKANGGMVVNGPMDVPGGDRIAQIIDPLGAMIAVHSTAATAATAGTAGTAGEQRRAKRGGQKEAGKAVKKKPAKKKAAKKVVKKRPAAKKKVAKKKATKKKARRR
jgi:predicted enzyme related to lactoylglutathione lyase